RSARTSSLWLTHGPGVRHCTVLVSSALPFFFFQAEDGIRDRNVTGVQTCALPISTSDSSRREFSPRDESDVGWTDVWVDEEGLRSEERRVGKECRARWARRQWKKKKEGDRGEVGSGRGWGERGEDAER